MNQTELVTEIMKITGHKRSLDFGVAQKLGRLVRRYEAEKKGNDNTVHVPYQPIEDEDID